MDAFRDAFVAAPRRAIRQRTNIELNEPQPSRSNDDSLPDAPADETSTRSSNRPWATRLVATLVLAAMLLTAWAVARRESVRHSIERLLANPPAAVAPEAPEPQTETVTFDDAFPDELPRGKRGPPPGEWSDSPVQMTATAGSVSGDHQPGAITLTTHPTA